MKESTEAEELTGCAKMILAFFGGIALIVLCGGIVYYLSRH